MRYSDITYTQVHPEKLVGEQLNGIGELRREYYQGIFEEAGLGVDMDEFMSQSSLASWINPNAGPRRSRRANPNVTIATGDRDEILGYVYTADDASSRLPAPLSSVEEWAKLHMSGERFLRSRWFWIRELVAPYDERDIPEGLGAVATVGVGGRVDELRPVSCYPWETEYDLRYLLHEWGVRGGVFEEPERVEPVPGSGVHITQFHRTSDSLAETHAKALEHPGLTPDARQAVEDLKVFRGLTAT